MARSGQTRIQREAWATSVAIHLWLAALLIWWLLAHSTPKPQPIVLTTIDLGGLAGDRAQGTDLPAPKPLTHAHARPVYDAKAIAEPRPLARHRSAQPHQRAARTDRVRPVEHVDMAKLLQEEKRQEQRDQQLASAADDTGSPTGASNATGKAARQAAGGAVSVGHGASGDLAGRAILSLDRPEFPQTAAGRHAPGWAGTVIAEIEVSPDGHIARVRILRSSGDPDVDATAQAAFARWRFSPLPAGQAAVQVGEVRMRFVLR